MSITHTVISTNELRLVLCRRDRHTTKDPTNPQPTSQPAESLHTHLSSDRFLSAATLWPIPSV